MQLLNKLYQVVVPTGRPGINDPYSVLESLHGGRGAAQLIVVIVPIAGGCLRIGSV
jgi:hypothetical protein